MLKKIQSIIKRVRLIKNWYEFIYPMILWNTSERVVYMRNGLVFHFRDSKKYTDWATFDELILRDVYNVKNFPSQASRILDLGANIGVFSLLMAKKYPNATIYAFEPEESNFRILENHIKINKLKNIIPVKKAISNRTGKAVLNIGYGNSANHSMVLNVGTGTIQEIETVNIEDFLPADIIKSDIEGAEYMTFEKIPNCKTIAMETHKPELDAEFLNRFRELYNITSDTNKIIHFLTAKN